MGVKDRIGWAAFPARLPYFAPKPSDKNLIY
jgi:hypothetical protein